MGFWDELGKTLEDSLKDVDETLNDARKRQHEELKKNLAGLGTRGSQQSEREREIDHLISDPNALNSFLLQELEHQRLTAQSELERLQRDLGKQEAKVREIDDREPYLAASERVQRSFHKAQAESYKEQARKRTLLISLIEAKKNEPKKPAPPPPAAAQPPDAAELRALKKAEILARLEALPGEEQKMAATIDDEEMKRRIQNMYAQKRAELLEDLSKWI